VIVVFWCKCKNIIKNKTARKSQAAFVSGAKVFSTDFDLNLVQLELDSHVGEGARETQRAVVEQMIDDLFLRLDGNRVLGVPQIYAGQLLALVSDLQHGRSGFESGQIILTALSKLPDECFEFRTDSATTSGITARDSPRQTVVDALCKQSGNENAYRTLTFLVKGKVEMHSWLDVCAVQFAQDPAESFRGHARYILRQQLSRCLLDEVSFSNQNQGHHQQVELVFANEVIG